MNSRFAVIAFLLLNTLTFKTFADDANEYLSDAVSEFSEVKQATDNAGIIDCNCTMKEGAPYMSFVMGNGKASEGGQLAWKAFSLRLGKEVTENTRIDFVHINEGHPYNNHRDGFAIVGAYVHPVTKNLTIEVSGGPYFSMNTTEINGVEMDDKRLGLLGTVAALYSLDRLHPGLQARIEYNHVIMPGAMTTDSVMVGVAKKFDTKNIKKGPSDNSTEVAVIGDLFITNHGDVDEVPKGYQIEISEKVTDNTSASLSYMKEGTDARVERQGVAAQYWYNEKLSKKITASVGAGMYIADNKRDQTNGKVNGLISIQVGYDVNKRMKLFVRVNRIADPKGSNDRDVLGMGVSGKF